MLGPGHAPFERAQRGSLFTWTARSPWRQDGKAGTRSYRTGGVAHPAWINRSVPLSFDGKRFLLHAVPEGVLSAYLV